MLETQNFFGAQKKKMPKISNSYHFENAGKSHLAKLVHFASADEMDIKWLHVTIQMTAVLPTRAVMIMMVKATSQKSPRDQDISLLGGELGQVTKEAINWREIVVKKYAEESKQLEIQRTQWQNVHLAPVCKKKEREQIKNFQQS